MSVTLSLAPQGVLFRQASLYNQYKTCYHILQYCVLSYNTELKDILKILLMAESGRIPLVLATILKCCTTKTLIN